MHRDDALAELPRAHGLALRLAELGADQALIADCLGVAPEAVGPLLEIAAAKLAHLLAAGADPSVPLEGDR